MKIFYSWQSDTPRVVGKEFIRRALDTAVSSIQVDEAERPEVDQDTAGILGSPIIADAIFAKIRASRVFVADVTLTGRTEGGKRLTNSNVAIEIGYAIGVHGDQVLLKVMNTYYGSANRLPFDFRHRRWPVQYSLAPDSTESERQRIFDELVGELKGILEDYVRADQPTRELFLPTPSTMSAGTYWQSSEALIQHGDPAYGDKVVSLGFRADQPLIYLRIWPHEKVPALSAAILQDYGKSVIEPLLGTRTGWTHARNRYGQISYEWRHDNTISSTTQVFKTGEIWGINEHHLRTRDGMRNFVPIVALENGLQNSLTKYLQAGHANFDYPKIVHVEFGLLNVGGYRLALPGNTLDLSGEIYEDVKVTTTIALDQGESVGEALHKILSGVYEAAGEIRR